MGPGSSRAVTARRRGTVLIAVVIALIMVSLVVTGIVIAGSRDQNLAALRAEGERARFAADAAVNMAIKELFDNDDHDGDGGIGSISDDDDPSTDPTLNGVRFWATRDDAESGVTVTGHAEGTDAGRAVRVTASMTGSGSDAAFAFADDDTPTVVESRAWSGGGWSAPATIGTLTANVNQIEVAQNPGGAVAVVALADSGAVSLFHRDSATSSWSVNTVSTNAGCPTRPVAAAEYERLSGDLLIVYRSGSSNSLAYRTRVGGVLSAESAVSFSFTSPPEEIVIAPRRASNEMLVLARAGARIAASKWNGSAFGSVSSLTTTGNTMGRVIDVAYESVSGQGLAVYGQGNRLRRRVYSGTSWGSASNAATASGNIVNVRLAPNPASDAMVAAYSDTAGVLKAIPWTGSGWGSAITLESSAGGRGPEPLFDIAYQPNGAKAVVAWARPLSSLVRYRTWSGAAWTSETSGPTLSTAVRRVRLSPGQDSTEVVGAALIDPSPVNLASFLVYSDATCSTDSTVVNGRSGANAPGVNLPASPGSSYGSTDLIYGNNATVTISPGSYRDAAFGNSSSISLSAGTYRFRSFNISGKNNVSITANTAAGDVTIVIASGGLSHGNSFSLVATGGGAVHLHLIAGNYAPSGPATLNGVNLAVYAGTIVTSNSLNVTGSLRASGAISLDSGTINWHPSCPGAGGALSSLTFTNGVAGSVTTVSAGLRGSPLWNSFEVGSSLSGGLSLTGWTEVSP